MDGFLVQINTAADVSLLLHVFGSLCTQMWVLHVSVCLFDSYWTPQSLLLHQLQLSLQILLVLVCWCSCVFTSRHADQTSCRQHAVYSVTVSNTLEGARDQGVTEEQNNTNPNSDNL